MPNSIADEKKRRHHPVSQSYNQAELRQELHPQKFIKSTNDVKQKDNENIAEKP